MIVEFKIPSATYRLQFNPQFQFSNARSIVSYLDQLGISDIYASPIFMSRHSSPHGYDVVDSTRLNPELGSEAEFELLIRETNQHTLGLLLDIVPNHMAISSENPFWMDVMENGQSSRYADFFDVDWLPCGSDGGQNKVILPILGEPYGQALENKDIFLSLEDAVFFIRYQEARLPVSLKSWPDVLSYRLDSPLLTPKVHPEDMGQTRQLLADIEKLPVNSTEIEHQKIKRQLKDILARSPGLKEFVEENLVIFNGEKGNPHSFDLLDRLLDRQAYRLAFWRTGRENLNFRRFFDINNLAGVRVELPEVMKVTHGLVFRLVEEGKVTGLRIDHIDGLFDPAAYLDNLRKYMGRFYVVVEKILSGEETLPGDWAAYGTTGYDFARAVNNVFVDGSGITKLTSHYIKMIEKETDFASVVYEKKKLVIRELFMSEAHSLGCRLQELASRDRYARDLTEKDLTQALMAVSAGLPVYRTYSRSFEVSVIDRQYLEISFREALSREPEIEPTALEFLMRVICLEFPVNFSAREKEGWLHWVMKWQQFTGPATAKGLEDTALYVYNRLVSLNVIGAPVRSGSEEWEVDEFHRFNIERQAHWPLSLNATTTHDTKRSEDVNARINILSEIPRQWTVHLSWWRRMNYIKKRKVNGQLCPAPNTEELLYQSLIGAWPLAKEEIPEFKTRFKSYILKALREGKEFTNWIRPEEKYEQAVLAFIDDILEESDGNEFLEDFISFQKETAFYGASNSLGQTLLKITSPGVPDFYQGTELWNLSLVDPDNRRPVDYDLRQTLLERLQIQAQENLPALIQDILKHWDDGRVKLFLTSRALHFRRENAELFQQGNYLPLYAEGRKKDHLIAFARHWEDRWIIVAVPRLLKNLAEVWTHPTGKQIWKSDMLVLPQEAPNRWSNVFTGETINASEPGKSLPLASVFNTFPVALWRS